MLIHPKGHPKNGGYLIQSVDHKIINTVNHVNYAMTQISICIYLPDSQISWETYIDK